MPELCHQVVSDEQSTMKSLWTSIDARKSTVKQSVGGRPSYGARMAVQCFVIASMSLFVTGVVVTGAGFGPLRRSSSHPSAIVVSLQVLGLSLLGVAGTVWVVGAVLYFKWKRRVKRRQRAARLRNRVQLHALAIDVLHRRPQPGDILTPADRQQLLDQLRLLEACEKDRGSLLTRSNSTLAMSDAKLSPTFEPHPHVHKSDITDLVNVRRNSKDVGQVRRNEKQEVALSDGANLFSVSKLPGIYISHFDPPDADECGLGETFYIDQPRVRCETFSGTGRVAVGCTLMVRQTGGSSFSSGTSLLTSVPSSSRGSLPLGDSGWEGDVSHAGSLSAVSRRDSLGVPPSGVFTKHMPTNSPYLPLISQRRHSTSAADQKAETWNFDCQRCEGRRRTCDYSAQTDERRSTCQGQTLDVYCSISTSRSLNDSMYICVDQHDPAQLSDFDSRRRLMTVPTDRRRRRRRDSSWRTRRVTGSELRAIWLSDVLRQHTDDSDVERRVERVLYEIDHSVTDSVDESKIQSPDFEFLSD